MNVKTYFGYWVFRGWGDLLSKTCRWYGLWKSYRNSYWVMCVRYPVSGLTCIVPWRSPRMLLVALRPSFLEHWLPCRPRVLFVSFEMIAQIFWCHFAAILKRKNALLHFDCDPELDLHIADVSSPTLHSAVVLLSVVSRLRTGSHVIGWPSWMEWDGREQRPSCYDIFLFFVLASCVPWKATQKILLNLTSAWFFQECLFLFSSFFFFL